MTAAADPLRYFRIEARDIAEEMGRDVLRLEAAPAPDLVPRLLRLAHTLKGAARIVKQREIAELAHAIEETLAPLRAGAGAAGRGDIDRLLRQVDAIAAHVAALSASATPRRVVDEPASVPQADHADLDALSDGVAEASHQLRLVRGAVAALAGAHSGIVAGLDRVEREIATVRDAATRLRLAPAAGIFAVLERTVRDVAQAQGKEAMFVAHGGDIRLDAALRCTPCLMLIASEDDGAEVHALDTGADAFVRKEEDIGLMLARIKAVLRSAEARSRDHGTVGIMAPKKVLAVDDSETYLRTLAAQLLLDGLDVVLARSGEEALALLAVRPVDCILLDLVMPGISGHETCRRIKATPGLRDIPVVMLTALEDRAAMIEGLAAGADDYIAKSSDFAVLRARVAAQIRRKQFEDDNRLYRERLSQKELETAEARAAQRLAETRAAMTEQLELKNRELEAFSYSVSHDLRAPLRTVDGFARVLIEDHAGALDPTGRDYLRRMRAATQRMGELIDDLLQLSQVSRVEIGRESVDLSAIARLVGAELTRVHPERAVHFEIADGLIAEGDARLLRIVLENLLGNAWKYSRDAARPTISFGATGEHKELIAYFVHDNGAGFDMAFAHKLFMPFERLHSGEQFPGTGIGLATVQRIVARHGGRIWAESTVGAGATFFWTLGKQSGGTPV